MASPITANSTSWDASAPMVAPTSSTTLSLRMVGHMAAMAGRSMCGSVRSLIRLAVTARAASVAAEAPVEAQTVESKDLPPPEPGDLLAKARAIAASKGLGGGEDEARARAALAPLGGGDNRTGDGQSTFQRAAMRFDAQGRGEKLEPGDPREIFRKAQALAQSRAQDSARQDALQDARAFGALAPAQNPLIAKPETYFVEALRLRQQQSALALGRSLQ